MAKLGAKLQYIKRMKNQCPSGTELAWFKRGGKLCKACLAAQREQEYLEEYQDEV
jgi:hypothetical protein